LKFKNQIAEVYGKADAILAALAQSEEKK
jgi:hypothetical protein